MDIDIDALERAIDAAPGDRFEIGKDQVKLLLGAVRDGQAAHRTVLDVRALLGSLTA